jgi:carboxyl-terminal processing protease
MNKNKNNKKLIITFLLVIFKSTITYAEDNNKLPIDDLQRFSTVLESIKNYYVNPIDDHVLFNNAIRGMLGGLDPHSAYLDKDEFSDLKVSTTGKFGGLGIEVTIEDGFIRVITPIDDTPAKKAGIEAGDFIIRLNDIAIRGMALREAVDLMRGKPGTNIELTILRKNHAKPLKIIVTRDIINVQSVRHEILDKNYAYLRISQFQNDTAEELIRQIRTIKKTVGHNLSGLILDLRNNPGGIFESSVATVNAFLNQDKLKYDGLIVYTKGRIAKAEIKEFAKGKDMLNSLPMVVLINGGSASASEIVAGALQDHKRAIILGTKSFGKGSVQTVLPLKDNRGLKLTTALYYTPAGRSIQATGIIPDLLVENKSMQVDNLKDKDQDLISIKESDLQGHLLTNNALKSESGDNDVAKEPENASNSRLSKDYQLYQGLMVLKSMSILTNQK